MKKFSTFRYFNILFCKSIFVLSIAILGFGCYDDTKTEIQKEAIVEIRTLCDGETQGQNIAICSTEIINGQCCVTICNLDRWNGCYVSLSFVQIGTTPPTLYPISNGETVICFSPLPDPLKIWVYCNGVTVTCKSLDTDPC